MANREELLAEARRRKLDVSAYDKSELMMEAKKRGLNIPGQEEPMGWDAVGNDVWNGIKKGAANIPHLIGATAGALFDPHDNGFFNTPHSDDFESIRKNRKGKLSPEESDPLQNPKILGASLATGTRNLANIPSNIVDYGKEREILPEWMDAWKLPEDAKNFDFYEASGAKPETNSQQFLSGLGESIPGLAATGGIGSGYPGLAANAIGADRNPLEDLVTAWLTHKGFQGIKKGANAISNAELPAFASQKKAGAQVGGDAKALAKELGDVYKKVKKASKDTGIKADTKQTVIEAVESGLLDSTTGKPFTRQVSKTPTMQEISAELPGVPKSVQRNVHNALETGDIGELIDAEKMLGKTKHKAWMDDKRNLKALDQDSYDAMTHMENTINDHISEALNKHNPTLADELFAARNKYHVELGPYLDVPAIREYMYGNLTEKDMVRLLQSNTKSGTQFRAKLADKYKAVGQNKFKNDLVKMGLKTGRISEILFLLGGH